MMLLCIGTNFFLFFARDLGGKGGDGGGISREVSQEESGQAEKRAEGTNKGETYMYMY